MKAPPRIDVSDFKLLTIRQTARDVLQQSERKLWADIASKRFGPDVLRIGRCVRIRAGELKAWLAHGAPPRADWLRTRGEDWS